MANRLHWLILIAVGFAILLLLAVFPTLAETGRTLSFGMIPQHSGH